MLQDGTAVRDATLAFDLDIAAIPAPTPTLSAEKQRMADAVAYARRPVYTFDNGALAAVFAGGGAVHVREALDRDSIAVLHAAADELLQNWTELAASNCLPAALEVPLRRRYIPLGALGDLEGRLRSSLPPSFAALARQYLGKEPMLATDSHVRSITLDRPDAHLPFHQDETILGRRLLNVWIPLDACGVDAPGLELVWNSWTRRLDPAPSPEATYPVERARLDPVEVERTFGRASRWRPVFAAGDAMVFSGATIHRTYVQTEMTRARLSVEIRLL